MQPPSAIASRAAAYILCGRCGVYLAAVAEIEGVVLATLNLNAFDPPPEAAETVPVSYEGESAADKARRRLARWTPVRIELRPAPD